MTESERCRFFDGGVCLHEKFEGATEVSDLFCAQCLDRLPMKKWLGPVPETQITDRYGVHIWPDMG